MPVNPNIGNGAQVYQLGQYVRRHNRRMNARSLVAGAFGAASALRGAYSSLPGRSEQGLVARVVRASHEPKNKDQLNTGTISTSTYATVLLNSVDQGTSANNRTGRQIQRESLRLRFMFNGPNTQPTPVYVRVLVTLDRESRGTGPALSDVLANVANLNQQIISSYNFDNVPSRLTVLFDTVVVLQPQSVQNVAATTWIPQFKQVICDVPLKGATHFYNSTGSGIGDIDSGAIHFFLMQDNVSIGTQFFSDSRFIFRDV